MSLKRNSADRRKLREKLYKKQNGLCYICGLTMSITNPKSTAYATFDHVIPRIQGGVEAQKNLRLACSRCNHKKGGERL